MKNVKYPGIAAIVLTTALGLLVSDCGGDDKGGDDKGKPRKGPTTRPSGGADTGGDNGGKVTTLAGPSNKPKVQTPEVPIYIEGTIGQFGQYVGLTGRKVQGYGVVVGLGKNGSSEMPETIRKYLIQYLQRRKLGFWRAGTARLHPVHILRDLDTAVVLVVGEIPHGAPKGSRFDLRIQALAGTNTRSLAGGVLMPAELRLAIGGLAVPGGPTHVWGDGRGEVFISPVLDRSKPAAQAELQKGRVIGGGHVTRYRPVRLMLRDPSFRRARQIEERINQRFRTARAKRPVASARSDEVIDINIPDRYTDNRRHFLNLVLRLPLTRNATTNELQAKRLLAGMARPKARHEQLALSLEAIGSDILPMIQPHYASNEPYVAFFSARTGLRMGDTTAAPVLLQAARKVDSPLQVRAIEELARYPDLLPGAIETFRSLLDDKKWPVRLAACDALIEHKDSVKIRRTIVGKRFTLDVVQSKGEPVIYATQTGEARIVVFGGDLPVSNPMSFALPDELVTISDTKRPGGTKLMLYRKVPRSPGPGNTLYIDFKTTELIRTLGGLPDRNRDGTVKALSLTYSQVLRVLRGLCNSKTGGINARFELQAIAE